MMRSTEMKACMSYIAFRWWFLADKTPMEMKMEGFDMDSNSQHSRRKGNVCCLATVQTFDKEFKNSKVVRSQRWRLAEE